MGNSYTVGHNHMSDWTEEELAVMFNYIAIEPTADEIAEHTVGEDYSPIDWRTKRNKNFSECLIDIQDQGACSSDWAFSTQLSMGANHCIQQDSSQMAFSVQYLVDCVTTCYACNGGNVALACNFMTTANTSYNCEIL